MSDSRIKTLIYDSIISYFNNDINHIVLIVICSIIYKNIKNMISSGLIEGSSSIYESITDQIQLVTVRVNLELAVNISLDDIENYLDSNELGNFKFMTNNQINNIVILFNNRIEYKPFSTKYFSSSMYKVPNTSINIIYMKKLRNVHENLMIPIINYYKEKYDDIYDYSLDIVSSTEGRYPGKVINFKINGITSESIANDIFMNRINISYAKVNDFNGMVEIVTNI